MAQERPVASTEEIEFVPVRAWEIDIGLHYVDRKYEEEVDADLLRIVFNTVQRRRTPDMRLHDLVRIVVDELITESDKKRFVFRAAIGKIHSNRRRLKEARPGYAPAVKQTAFPFDPVEKDQRSLLGTLKETAR